MFIVLTCSVYGWPAGYTIGGRFGGAESFQRLNVKASKKTNVLDLNAMVVILLGRKNFRRKAKKAGDKNT